MSESHLVTFIVEMFSLDRCRAPLGEVISLQGLFRPGDSSVVLGRHGHTVSVSAYFLPSCLCLMCAYLTSHANEAEGMADYGILSCEDDSRNFPESPPKTAWASDIGMGCFLLGNLCWDLRL